MDCPRTSGDFGAASATSDAPRHRRRDLSRRAGLAALALIAMAPAGAFAADMPELLRGSYTPTYTSWEGFYFGGQAAYLSGGADFGNATQPLVAYILRNTFIEDTYGVSQWTTLGKRDANSSGFGGFVGYNCTRPTLVGNPNASPCIPGTLFNTCAFAHNTAQGTFGDAGRNIIQGPGYKTWDTSLVKQFPISEQKHLEFRAEIFNVLNHVNYLFGSFGAISVEPTPLELDPNNINTPTNPRASSFGYPLAACPPRQIQFALKFYF